MKKSLTIAAAVLALLVAVPSTLAIEERNTPLACCCCQDTEGCQCPSCACACSGCGCCK